MTSITYIQKIISVLSFYLFSEKKAHTILAGGKVGPDNVNSFVKEVFPGNVQR